MHLIARPRESASRTNEASFEREFHGPDIKNCFELSVARLFAKIAMHRVQRGIKDEAFEPSGSTLRKKRDERPVIDTIRPEIRTEFAPELRE